MIRPFVLPIILATVVVLSTPAAAQQAAKPVAGAAAPTPTATPGVVDNEAQAMRDAVSAVVVVALTEQFDGKQIAVDFADYAMHMASVRQRSVSGHGTVRILGKDKGKGDAVGFTYRTLYDVVNGQAGFPSISIIGVGGGAERAVPNDSGLVDEMDDRVASAISHDLGGNQVWLQLNRIDSYQSGDRYMRIDASGIADFATDGRSGVRIEALYDLGRKSWLRVNYQLDGSADTGPMVMTTQAGSQ